MKPTVGQIVNFWAGKNGVGKNGNQPYPAIITHVWDDECVNLCVFNDPSAMLSATNMALPASPPTLLYHSVVRSDKHDGPGPYAWSWIETPAELREQYAADQFQG